MDWLGAWVKGHEIGGITPCVDFLIDHIFYREVGVVIDAELFQRQVDIGFLAIFGIEIDHHDDPTGTIVRPLVLSLIHI
mgnify:CR=1 FL=1